MEKKLYVMPTTKFVAVCVEGNLLDGTVTNVDGDDGFSYGGGGSGPALAGQDNVWDSGIASEDMPAASSVWDE